jgi:RNA polymerase sigma-54 factor
VAVKKVRGRWTASLNREAMPRLRINRLYADILQRNRGSGLAGQLQEATLVDQERAAAFRHDPARVAGHRRSPARLLLDHGAVAMRPLVLREIAEALGLHESTVSRVTTQKYMLEPAFGTL